MKGEGKMEIKISFKLDEMKEILKAHVLKELPINQETNNIYITESYGKFTVEVEEKTVAKDQKVEA